jgi:endonuclease/exonuclease/phosphatase family metal-dependent hydrolase
MWVKLLLTIGFLIMLAGAFHFEPVRERTLLGTRTADGPRLRLLTWNIGYAGLEKDSRAHDQDLKAIADIILQQDPDGVALQELSSPDQLEILLEHLQRRYQGAVGRFGNHDRVAAVLVKAKGARFEDIPSGDRYALSGRFRWRDNLPEILLISAHADAFNAARRRAFTSDLVDWARQKSDAIVFIAGDFNLEVNGQEGDNLYSNNFKHDSEAYNYILRHYRDLARDAGATSINDRRIDYIFGPPETVLLRRAEVLKNSTVGRMDHWPLLVEVAL